MTKQSSNQAATFKELYLKAANKKPKVSPGQRFIEEIAAVTHRSAATVRMWLYGGQVPDDYVKATIAEHLGVRADQLFPSKSEEYD